MVHAIRGREAVVIDHTPMEPGMNDHDARLRCETPNRLGRRGTRAEEHQETTEDGGSQRCFAQKAQLAKCVHCVLLVQALELLCSRLAGHLIKHASAEK